MEHFFQRIERDGSLLAWEPRGKWEKRRVEELCQRLNLIYCLDPFKTPPREGGTQYFRLHGIGGYRYRYTSRDLFQIKEWCKKHPTYCLFNNIYMWNDALRFKSLWEGEK